MKTIFRFLTIAVVAAAGVVAGNAQDNCADVDGQNAIYTPFTETYNKKPYTVVETEKAIELGKSFLEKYGTCEPVKAQVDFVKPWVPKLEKRLEDLKMAEKYARFDKGLQSKNYDEAYAAGKEILAARPKEINIMVPLGLIGLYQSYDKNFKYNEDTLRFAQTALTNLKAKDFTAKSNGKVGAFEFECAPADCISELTYGTAYINFWAKKDKTAALPLYYEVTQLPGRNKENPLVYEAIGTYYIEQAAPIGVEIAKLIEDLKTAPEEKKLEIDGQVKAKIALFKGYSERIIDAFGRAHKFTKDAGRKATLYKKLEEVYQQRFEKKDGLDTYLASTVNKPLPNPTSTVEPVVDPEAAPATTTTTGTTSSTPAPAAKPAATPTKPMSTVGTKASTAATTSSASTDAVAKKPVAKKKGTR